MLAGLDSQHVERRIAVGLAHARAGHADLAVLTLGSAIGQSGDQPLVYGALGRVWLEIAEAQPDRPDAMSKALEALSQASSAASATSEIKTLYGRALLRDRQTDAAEQVFQQATERYPVDPAAFAEYAAVAEKHNHLAEARDALISYHGLVGDDAGFAARALKIGQLSLRVNEETIALPWLQRAVAATPNDIRVLAALADAQYRTGDKDGAQASRCPRPRNRPRERRPARALPPIALRTGVRQLLVCFARSTPHLAPPHRTHAPRTHAPRTFKNHFVLRGSMRSRRPSPRKLNPSTRSAMARPGNIVRCGASSMCARPPLSIVPQLGVGG